MRDKCLKHVTLVTPGLGYFGTKKPLATFVTLVTL